MTYKNLSKPDGWEPRVRQAERFSTLFRLAVAVMDKPGVTTKELSEKFNVSKRTIYRYVEILKKAGIPIRKSVELNGYIIPWELRREVGI